MRERDGFAGRGVGRDPDIVGVVLADVPAIAGDVAEGGGGQRERDGGGRAGLERDAAETAELADGAPAGAAVALVDVKLDDLGTGAFAGVRDGGGGDAAHDGDGRIGERRIREAVAENEPGAPFGLGELAVLALAGAAG